MSQNKNVLNLKFFHVRFDINAYKKSGHLNFKLRHTKFMDEKEWRDENNVQKLIRKSMFYILFSGKRKGKRKENTKINIEKKNVYIKTE